jgi:hypothetical protein
MGVAAGSVDSQLCHLAPHTAEWLSIVSEKNLGHKLTGL